MTKPMIRVTKHRDDGHLYLDGDVLCLDALTLADDFEAAYWNRLRPKIQGDFKANMETRFREMRTVHWQEREEKKHELAKVPSRPQRSAWGSSTGTQVNSPSVPPLYSTNVSTSDFDEPPD
jgi:hypothetical protein